METDKQIATKNTLRPVATWVIFAMMAGYFFQKGWGLYACSVFAGYFMAVWSTLLFHFSTSSFSFKSNLQYWNPAISFKNKYNADGSRKKWLNFIPVPVFLTDAFHLFQSLMLTSMFGAIAFALFNNAIIGWWQDVIVCYVALHGTFILFYSWLFKID